MVMVMIRGKVTVLVVVGLYAAFDIVGHILLKTHVYLYGMVSGTALQFTLVFILTCLASKLQRGKSLNCFFRMHSLLPVVFHVDLFLDQFVHSALLLSSVIQNHNLYPHFA